MPDTPDFRSRFRALLTGERQPISAYAPSVREDGTVAVLRLYDVIDSWGGPWGTSAAEVAVVLDELPDSVTEIHLHINSPGGEVTEGVAVLNVLKNHPARVVAYVDGLAASAASFLAVGCDELVMCPNTELMIHEPWGLCVGNSDDMRSLAGVLDHMADNIASIYQQKAGGTVEDWRDVMRAETWYSAQEAVAAGLADRVANVGDNETDEDADKAKARFDLSIFSFSGRQQAPGPQHPAPHTGGGPEPTPKGGPAVAFSDEQFTHLRQALDLPDDADEAAVFAALDSKLKEYVEDPPPNPPSPTATLPDGVVPISAEQLAALQADAQAGREAREAQIRSGREATVSAAIRDGRIAPAERDAWLAKLEANTGADEVLAALKPGVVPVNEIGSAGSADLDSDEALYASLFGSGKPEEVTV